MIEVDLKIRGNAEEKRLCGWRKVGAMYLCGEYIPVSCDRMPFPLETCPVCGGGIKVSRGFTQIKPLTLWGIHQECRDILPCHLCFPTNDPAYIMLVGEKFYPKPEDFIREALELGISKRIPFIPKNLVLGKTVVYLAHPKAVEVEEPIGEAETLLEVEKVRKVLGIFCAFIPQRVEKLIWQSEATPKELEKLKKRGITPVIISDKDLIHAENNVNELV